MHNIRKVTKKKIKKNVKIYFRNKLRISFMFIKKLRY